MSRSFKDYFGIQMAILLGTYVAIIAIYIVLICFMKSKKTVETTMFAIDGIVTQKNVQTSPKYFICGRECPSGIENKVVWVAATIIGACVSLFMLLLIIEVKDECRNDPNLDCFKKNKQWSSTGFFYENSRTNCSAISSADVVLCFRLDFPDFERFAVAGGASYVAFRIMINCLHFTTYCILCSVDNCSDCNGNCNGSYKAGSCKCLCITFIIMVVVVVGYWCLLRFCLKSYSYQLENISFIPIFQIVLAIFPFFIFVLLVPWREFKECSKHLEELSIPMPWKSAGVIDNTEAE